MGKQPTETDSIISFARFNFLKSLDYSSLTEVEKQQLFSYEKYNNMEDFKHEFNEKYIDRIPHPPVIKTKIFTKKEIWDDFQIAFVKNTSEKFIVNDETLANIKPLMYYFMEDPAFFECVNLSHISQPSFNKGLLIVGNYGNGKTSTMMAFERVFKEHTGYSFKSYSANEVVEMYERTTNEDRGIFYQKMDSGKRYFDDVKTEKEASNFGKVNLFKEILETRERLNRKTYITCNFKKGFPEDVNAALDEFEEKYGERVYDRIFKMFNIIVFKGKSFRR